MQVAELVGWLFRCFLSLLDFRPPVSSPPATFPVAGGSPEFSSLVRFHSESAVKVAEEVGWLFRLQQCLVLQGSFSVDLLFLLLFSGLLVLFFSFSA